MPTDHHCRMSSATEVAHPHPRDVLLTRCTFSDRDCVDLRVRDTCTARTDDEFPPPWPPVGHSCDFCDAWPLTITTCGACHRWLGLSDCDCAMPASARCDANGATQTTVAESPQVQCKWCDAHRHANEANKLNCEAPPPPIGHSEGILRRVVFVIEPQQRGTWKFHMARRLLIPILEMAGVGTVLVYGFWTCETVQRDCCRRC